MPGAEPFEIQARDGHRLGATLFRPAAGNGRALQINAAAGVKQEYYGKFAAYLAERGFSVLTFDYRGIGRSGSFRLKNARMRDWAELDAAAALDFLAQTKSKLMAIGHSFGGQSFALIPGAERLAAALAVGSQSGYWRHWRGARRAECGCSRTRCCPVFRVCSATFPLRRSARARTCRQASPSSGRAGA